MWGPFWLYAWCMSSNGIHANTLNEGPARLQAKKSFGQNFLVNPSVITSIVASARQGKAVGFLEIGPGMGALTEALLGDGRPLTAIELDPDACAYLQERFGSHPDFSLLQGDAVHAQIPAGGPWSVVGNLPYNAATPILTRFLLEPIPWNRLVFMFQLEVGQKILGHPGEKAYGPLSVLSQLCCKVSRLMKLGPGSFRPSPKVDSVVLQFEPREDAPDHSTRKSLLALLHRSFAHRRKTLANNWQGWMDAEVTSQILADMKLPEKIRAEAVPLEAWLGLLRRVEQA